MWITNHKYFYGIQKEIYFWVFYLAIFINRWQRIIALRYSIIHENVNQIFDLIPKKA